MNSLSKAQLIFLFFINFMFIGSFISTTPAVVRIDLTACYTQLLPEIQEHINLYLDEYHSNPYVEIFIDTIESLCVMRLQKMLETILQVPCHQQIFINPPDQRFSPTLEQNPLIVDIADIVGCYWCYQFRGRPYYAVPIRMLSLIILEPEHHASEDDLDGVIAQFGELRMAQ